MTKEEAIIVLKYGMKYLNPKNDTEKDRNEALDMAISALSANKAEDRPKGEWDICGKELLKIYEDRFLELQKLKQLKDNKGAEDRQMGVNYCINILKEMLSVTPQTEKEGE